MRSFATRAALVLQYLAGMLGAEDVAKMSELEALRIGSRMERRSSARWDQGMSLAQLCDYASRRRRSAQTHPGKRGKR